MRQLLFILICFGFFACKPQTDNTLVLQNRIDSLEIKLADTYKPGFGEFMNGIQAHHSKLWLAGQNENWKLANFEVHEIKETIEAIKQFQTERKESQMIDMINPALEEINSAIQQKNVALFKSSYSSLTNTCNNCHRATKFEFIEVEVPDIH